MTSLSKSTRKLHNARVLVIGGSSGLGFAVAEALLDHGAEVIISSSSADKVAKAVQQLEIASLTAKGRVQGIPCNLSAPDTLESQVATLFETVGKGGKLDHVVHTAGDPLAVKKLESFSLTDMQQAGIVRFFSPLVVAQHLRQHLKPGPDSSYVVTTATGSARPMPEWAVLASYFAGLEGMCRGLARELAPIRVNAVCPGAVDTELWDGIREAGTFEGFRAQVESSMATGVFGRAEDVAEGYLYLMRDRNVTGSILTSDGGYLLM